MEKEGIESRQTVTYVYLFRMKYFQYTAYSFLYIPYLRKIKPLPSIRLSQISNAQHQRNAAKLQKKKNRWKLTKNYYKHGLILRGYGTFDFDCHRAKWNKLGIITGL